MSAYLSIEKEIIGKLFPESDHSVSDAARFFYGSPEIAEFFIETDGLNYPILAESIWDKDLRILGDDGNSIIVDDVKGHTVIFCPFHTDSTPSAFIDYSKNSKNHYIYCSRCNQSFWMRLDKVELNVRCESFYSKGTGVLQMGINKGIFYMENIGEKKFYHLSDSDGNGKQKTAAFKYLIDYKHIPHLSRVNFLGDVKGRKNRYQVDHINGVIDVYIAPIGVDIKDNDFIETYLTSTFGQYTNYIKQWLSVYTYTNYQKLPTNILKGSRGTSKSTFAEMVGEIYKPLSSEWHGHEQNFTYEVEKKLLIVEENEISSLNQYKTLKKYSGQKYATVNKKFQDPYEVKNNMNIILLANDSIPIYVNREELPNDEKNNQFFVFEMPQINKDKRIANMQEMLVRRLGHYLKTELKTVFDNLVVSGMNNSRYSIITPITNEEIALFSDNMTENESHCDLLIQKLQLTNSDGVSGIYDPFIKKGYLPVDLIKSDFELGSRFSAIIKTLKKRLLVRGNACKRQADSRRFYCYEMTGKLTRLINDDDWEQLGE
jgi:hypothetical protein